VIKATSSIEGPPLSVDATVSGLAIYLDTFAVIDLAKGNPSRRKKFIAALHSGADLLFSVSTAVELSGPKQRSLDAVRLFLDEVGPHWFPVELDAFEVVKRELSGASPAESCLSKQFMDDFFRVQMMDYSPASGMIINLAQDFFRLGRVVDWVGPQCDLIRRRSADMDDALIKRIRAYRIEFDRNPSWLDQKFPIQPFNSAMPATFAYVSLVRNLIVEEKSFRLKENDGLDFCHAVIASAFASIATLDKHWKRRVERLPKPNRLARIYYGPELDKMVTDIERYMIEANLPL
jgi:hypothetical protein